jgi:hypothetical protein
MSEVDSKRYQLGRLILDYLRVLIWPASILAVVAFYQDDVRDILRGREIELAGVFKIGQQVKQIEERAQEEIADIRALLDAQRERDAADAESRGGAEVEPVAADIETKLANLGRNISRSVTQINQAAPQLVQSPVQQVEPPGELRRQLAAADLERAGFRALIDRNVAEAIVNFDGARERYPEYHNVAEIAQYLRERQARLMDPDSPAWADLYRTIISKYSWGLPSDLRPDFRELAKETYLK